MDTLQPKAHYYFKSSNPLKIQRIYGSYNNIKENNFSYIYAFGALHNSTDLMKTFQEIYNSLSDDGFLISSDMSENFDITTLEENHLTDRLSPNSFDHYGKECTYRETKDNFRSIILFLPARAHFSRKFLSRH